MRKLITSAGDMKMKTSCRGFTLIEMAIVIMVIGLLVASLTPLYGLFQKQQEIETTQVNVTVAISAMGTFRSLYGRYPCPASLTVDRNDPKYGREDCEGTRTVAVGSSTPDEGIWVERSRRTAFAHEYPAGTPRNESPRVLVGALPFRNLNLEESQGYDSYDHRLVYVVTENLTCDKCFTPNGGGIDIIDDSGNSILPNVGEAHFLVMSYGKNGDGAYAKSGDRFTCAAAGVENDNCNYDDSATPDATYRLSINSSAKTAAEFDDVIDYFSQDEIPVWQMSTKQQLAIHQKALDGNVAVLKNDNDVQERGDIGGTVRASADPAVANTGTFQVNELCNSLQGECFRPELIAGDIETGTGGLRCPEDDTIGSTGKFMVGIEDGKPICNNAVTQECPADAILVGVESDGSLNCKNPDPLPCDGFVISMCDTIVTVWGGAHGEIQTVQAGASQQRTYECRNGSWFITQDVQGVCNCTPGVVSTTSGACGSGYSGTTVTTTTRTCPDGTLTNTPDYSACTCVDRDYPGSRPCPAGQTGTILTTSAWRCPAGGGPGMLYDPVDVPGGNSCTCVNEETRATSCTNGLTGSGRVETRTVTCNGSGVTYGPWVQQSYDCDCNPVTVTEPFPCDAGYTGNIIKRRSLQCPSGEWTDWVNVPGGNTCEPIPPVVCNWERTSSGLGPSSFGVGTNSASACSCGDRGPCYSRVGSGQFLNYSSCRCN